MQYGINLMVAMFVAGVVGVSILLMVEKKQRKKELKRWYNLRKNRQTWH